VGFEQLLIRHLTTNIEEGITQVQLNKRK
jgi:hypothetical protein